MAKKPQNSRLVLIGVVGAIFVMAMFSFLEIENKDLQPYLGVVLLAAITLGGIAMLTAKGTIRVPSNVLKVYSLYRLIKSLGAEK